MDTSRAGRRIGDDAVPVRCIVPAQPSITCVRGSSTRVRARVPLAPPGLAIGLVILVEKTSFGIVILGAANASQRGRWKERQKERRQKGTHRTVARNLDLKPNSGVFPRESEAAGRVRLSKVQLR